MISRLYTLRQITSIDFQNGLLGNKFQSLIVDIFMYCMSKKSCPILCSKLLYKLGQYLFGVQYFAKEPLKVLNPHEKVRFMIIFLSHDTYSSYPFYIVTYYDKMSHYFLDIQYINKQFLHICSGLANPTPDDIVQEPRGASSLACYTDIHMDTRSSAIYQPFSLSLTVSWMHPQLQLASTQSEK